MPLIFYKFYYYLFLFVLYYRAVFLIRNSRLKKIINTQLTTDVKRIMTVGCSPGSNTDAVLITTLRRPVPGLCPWSSSYWPSFNQEAGCAAIVPILSASRIVYPPTWPRSAGLGNSTGIEVDWTGL